MESNTIPINENTTVIVKASGDLFLRGEEMGEVRFRSGEDRIRVHQSNDTVYVETHASMDLEVPRHASIVVEKVGGSAFLQDLDGSLVVQKIGGDLALQRLGTVRVEKVGGTCLVDGVSDALAIGKVGSDLTVRQVAGRLEVGMIGGTGDLQALGLGALEIRAGADLRVYITDGLEGAVNLRAGGSVFLYLPAHVNGKFELNAGGQLFVLDLNRQEKQVMQNIEGRRYEFLLGAGGALVEVQAGADIHVSDEPVEPASILGDLERRESAWQEARERRGSPAWSAGFGFDRSSAWADMVSRRAQEAARRAEQRSQAAMRRTEDQIRQAAERQGRHEFERGFGFFGGPPAPPAPVEPAAPVTDQERLLVLQMLQEQKITVEQAEKLLAALEGRFNR